MDEKRLADFMECYCYLRNIQDLLFDGKRPYEWRFGIPFNGSRIPFGAMIEYHPISVKDLSKLSMWSQKCLVKYLLWTCVAAGRIRKGDVLFADIEEFEQKDASEIHARRLSAKEVSVHVNER